MGVPSPRTDDTSSLAFRVWRSIGPRPPTVSGQDPRMGQDGTEERGVRKGPRMGQCNHDEGFLACPPTPAPCSKASLTKVSPSHACAPPFGDWMDGHPPLPSRACTHSLGPPLPSSACTLSFVWTAPLAVSMHWPRPPWLLALSPWTPPLPHLTLSHRRARRGGIKKEHTHTHTHRRVRRGSSRKAATASICSAARAGSGGTSRPWVPPTAYLAHQAAAPLAGERTAVANALTQWQPP